MYQINSATEQMMNIDRPLISFFECGDTFIWYKAGTVSDHYFLKAE